MKLLVVGCGSIGTRHARLGSELVETAVCDASPARLQSLGGCVASRFERLEAALDWRPDAVVVAVPNEAHVAVAMQALDAGADVLVEKPISHDLAAAAALTEHAGALGRRVERCVQYAVSPRSSDPSASTRGGWARCTSRAHSSATTCPTCGPGADYRELYCANAARGGGVVLDAIHELDYLSWLLGPVREVRAQTARLSELDIDVEDYAAISLRHMGNAHSEIHLDYLQQYKRRGCEIIGASGTLVWQSEGKSPEHCTVRLFERDSGRWISLYEEADVDPDGPYRAMLESFLAPASDQRAALLEGRAACAALGVALAAKQAASGAGITPALRLSLDPGCHLTTAITRPAEKSL